MRCPCNLNSKFKNYNTHKKGKRHIAWCEVYGEPTLLELLPDEDCADNKCYVPINSDTPEERVGTETEIKDPEIIDLVQALIDELNNYESEEEEEQIEVPQAASSTAVAERLTPEAE
jgi:hypothetical protein